MEKAYVVVGNFDDGCSIHKVQVVTLADSPEDAGKKAKSHLERHSDDYLDVEFVRELCTPVLAYADDNPAYLS